MHCQFQRALIPLSITLVVAAMTSIATADTFHVPADYPTISGAIAAANSGDVIVVAAGRYNERIVLTPGITVRSAGDQERGEQGLRRAELTIIDGAGAGKDPGVSMAAGATLDGFTVTGVGKYDETIWLHHHATSGNEQEHQHIGAPGIAGIAVSGVDCIVRNNIVHHIGYTGIAIRGNEEGKCSPLIEENVCFRNMGGGIGSMNGSTATIRNNHCYENFYAGIGQDNASPLIVGNTCYRNIRAGIGISEGSCPIVRGNTCYENRRAGIGSRSLPSTRPIIESNECYENDMAGIGTEEHASPVIRKNRCFRNKLAGIGVRDHATATIIENECYENGTVGIGHMTACVTTLNRNHCHDNMLAGIGFSESTDGKSTLIENRVLNNGKVAIGIGSGWQVTAIGNRLSREGGLPPIVMIFAGGAGVFVENELTGSGVAGFRVAGELRATGNKIHCPTVRKGGPPNIGVWALDDSAVRLSDNTITGWRNRFVGQIDYDSSLPKKDHAK